MATITVRDLLIRRGFGLLSLLLLLSALGWAQQEPSAFPKQFEGDWNVPDFTFNSGEKLASLRLHYITLGSPENDAAGHARNAVLIQHATGGTGRNFLSAESGGGLFGNSQAMDPTPHHLTLP